MLTITPDAAEAIRTIVAETDSPEEAGIRISAATQAGTDVGLEISISEAPLEGDAVVEEGGAHVFLDDMAAFALDDKELDARMEGDEIEFGILDREDASN
jgi:iron-sulfur cluster assembly protein